MDEVERVAKPTKRFSAWIDELREDVIEGEYGYEPGEFNVFPDHWRPLYVEGLTPAEAFKRALDAHADERKRQDAERKGNWKRIQQADAAMLQAAPEAPAEPSGRAALDRSGG